MTAAVVVAVLLLVGLPVAAWLRLTWLAPTCPESVVAIPLPGGWRLERYWSERVERLECLGCGEGEDIWSERRRSFKWGRAGEGWTAVDERWARAFYLGPVALLPPVRGDE